MSGTIGPWMWLLTASASASTNRVADSCAPIFPQRDPPIAGGTPPSRTPGVYSGKLYSRRPRHGAAPTAFCAKPHGLSGGSGGEHVPIGRRGYGRETTGGTHASSYL